jgi:predicted TIM-barrel fold metal-dependent hydrolase
MSELKKMYTRRRFLAVAGLLAMGISLQSKGIDAIPGPRQKEPIIDIQQHIHFDGRTDEQILAHQRAMGIKTTFLLPSGRPVNSPSTHQGNANGLAEGAGGNAECYLFAKEHKKEFLFGACAVPDAPDAIYEIEKNVKMGAVMIGELKFGLECDSSEMQKIYQLAQIYNVPVLMHWEYQMYNYGFERFYKMLEKYPKVNFIGHAQTWWANIDKNLTDQSVLYPKGPVARGGIADRYLSDYPNMYADLASGSGLNALTRDRVHTKLFMERHQDKLIYGSDCKCTSGLASQGCIGALAIAEVRKLASGKQIERKLLYENAKKLFRL